MASIKYRIKGKSQQKEVSIYLRFSSGKEFSFEAKTGLSVAPKSWSDSTNFPKQSTAALKVLHRDLKKLEAYIYNAFNEDFAKGTILNKSWLDKVIRDCFNRIPVQDVYGVTEHIQHIIDHSDTRAIPGKNKIGLSKARVT